MAQPGTPDQPLRVAIVGSGPTGFYTAQHLFNERGLAVQVDVFDRLPTPFGLVRLGVAPDHEKIKSVIAVYEKTARMPGFRFYGNVEVGRHLSVAELRRLYHQIVYCTGAQTDRRLGIPGEDLAGSHTATEFVAWYNGHPEYVDRTFDLSRHSAVIVGVGNVAVDVARILCRTHQELARTDIADHALQSLRESRVRRVTMLGRRGPAQAAFTNAEIKELGELPAAECSTVPEETELDPVSRAELERHPDRLTERKLEILRGMAGRSEPQKPRQLRIRFLVSPVEIVGDGEGRVSAVRLVRNELYLTDRGVVKSRETGRFETLEAGLVFRSVGYRGVPIPGVPFDEDSAIFLNDKGRVLDPETRRPRLGEYAAGWIKRGPVGVIGTNKPDALETVRQMLEDLLAGRVLRPEDPSMLAAEKLIRSRQPDVFTYPDWSRLDALEVERGERQGRPRVKYTDVREMLAALGRAATV
jgi:ferredoxin--NADP+ reductase